MKESSSLVECSVVLPCRNEEASLGFCIQTITDVFERENIQGEIIVSDSSIDRSPDIVRRHGAILVKHDKQGYGIAYREGFRYVHGHYIFCADADGSYDFSEIPRFLLELRRGADLVIGNRFAGAMHPDAMPWLHRYVGNPLLSMLFRRFFNTPLNDVHCGMRALTRDALRRLECRTTGMEFASEMLVQALKQKLTITELPISYQPRQGTSKLKTFTDGWRHLRFMLLYSPEYLFLLPGLILFGIGLVVMGWLYAYDPYVGSVQLFFHPMFIASFCIITGYQLIMFALFAKTYAMTHLGDSDTWLTRFYYYATLEKGIIVAGMICITGLVLFFSIAYEWVASGFGALHAVETAIVGLTLLVLGTQTLFSSFMISMLSIRTHS